jgi:hypothetical protein
VDAGMADAAPILDGSTSDAAPPVGQAQVIINEVLANEPGSDVDAEFVEIVNIGDGQAELSGWTLSDSQSVRHIFDEVRLAPGEAWVVFGGESAIPHDLARAEAATKGALSLANGGDSAILRDASGLAIDRVDYGAHLAAEDGVSMTRDPDARAGAAFVLHSAVAPTDSSPGTRADGSGF